MNILNVILCTIASVAIAILIYFLGEWELPVIFIVSLLALFMAAGALATKDSMKEHEKVPISNRITGLIIVLGIIGASLYYTHTYKNLLGIEDVWKRVLLGWFMIETLFFAWVAFRGNPRYRKGTEASPESAKETATLE